MVPLSTRPRGRAGRRPPLLVEALEERALLSYAFTFIADGDRQSPYSALRFLAGINNDGVVAFQANLRAGGESVLASDGATVTPLESTYPGTVLATATPINNLGQAAYVTATGTYRVLWVSDGNGPVPILDTSGPYSSILLPDMNDLGSVAYVANLRAGGQAIDLYQQGGAYTTIVDTMRPADLQTFVNSTGHCGMTNAEYGAAADGLLSWIETKARPTQEDIVSSCQRYSQQGFGACRVNATYQPPAFESRVYPRSPW